MKYKVTVQELIEKEDEYNGYRSVDLYEQIVGSIDIKALVDVVNRVNEKVGNAISAK